MIPKPLRDHLGLHPGAVEVTADGNALRVEPVVDDQLAHDGPWLVIPASGHLITADEVRALRDADRR